MTNDPIMTVLIQKVNAKERKKKKKKKNPASCALQRRVCALTQSLEDTARNLTLPTVKLTQTNSSATKTHMAFIVRELQAI